MTTTVWTVKAVDVATGASPVTIAGAAVGSVSWALNDADGADIELRANDPDLAQFLDPTREIQVWRDAALLFWGPVVRVEVDDKKARIQCAGAWWYFTRRTFGKPDRTNLLLDGDFEAGAGNWSPNGGVTATLVNNRAVNGAWSIELTGHSQGHDESFQQTWTHPVGGHPLGDLVTLVGHVWLHSAGYQGTAKDTRGLYAEHRRGGVLIAQAFNTIDGTTPADQWHRLDTDQEEIEFPAVLAGDTINVRLYPPWGTANFDLVTLTFMESLSFGYPDDVEMADICAGIIEYAQDIFPGFVHGKTDLGVDTDCPATGVLLSRAYQFADHANVAEAIAEFAERRNGIDFAIVVTPTGRTFRTWHPRRGTVRDLPLVWGANMTSFRYSKDRTKQATSVVVLGPGDGPDREEGGASIAGVGPTLEDVSSAPDGTKIGELDHLAAETLDVLTHPEVLEVTCTGLLGAVKVGDWCPVTISALGISAVDYRIMTMTVDPATDAVTANLNLRDPL